MGGTQVEVEPVPVAEAVPAADAPEAPEAPEALKAEEEAVMRALARAMIVIPRVLDADLLRERRIAFNEYGTLMHLSEAPGRTLRMSELADALALSLSGMTRIVNRLEAEGLVERHRCGSDGRGMNAVLTDQGLARLHEAWPTHLASVRRHIMDHLGDLDLTALAEALGRIAPSAGCVLPNEGACPQPPA
jgi:DNA-binding MarR family transcriptional regulator